MRLLRRSLLSTEWRRGFSCSGSRPLIKDVSQLPDRIRPSFQETKDFDLLSLRWPAPPRNILLVRKDCSATATEAVLDFARHITTTYPALAILAEPSLASTLEEVLHGPIYTAQGADPERTAEGVATDNPFHAKTDLITTFGGDGTILHAASLFATATSVPPILSFSMGTLGFLGEWKFADHKRAFREMYMSGAPSPSPPLLAEEADAAVEHDPTSAWNAVRGQSMGVTRGARVLLRRRLRVSVVDSADSSSVSASGSSSVLSVRPGTSPTHALNEVLLHRGNDPHLAHISVSVNGRLLTEAVADGMLVSTPTGSTAYALSAGGSIIHPLVPSLLLTPVCPRSLSFRPLVLPSSVDVVLRLSERNRGRAVELSVDGVRRAGGVGVGTEIRVTGEELRGGSGGGARPRAWIGGVPCLVRGVDDGWVGGLNGLLKFNYPFGEEGGDTV